MNSNEMLLRGRNRCVGLVLDAPTAGEEECKRRVLARWSEVSELYRLPNSQWLLLFGTSVELSSFDTAAALVIEDGGGLSTAPGLNPQSRTLATWMGGEVHHIEVTDLERIDPSEWITPTAGIEILTMPVLPNPPIVAERVKGTSPNFREKAKVGEQSSEAANFSREIKKQQSKRRYRPAKGSGSRRSSVAPRSNQQARSNPLAKMLLKSPANEFLSKKHATYLRDLEQKFTSGNFDEALRNAIPIGGLGRGPLSLRLPKRRDSLQLSGGSTGGRSAPYDHTVQSHLNSLYRQAVKELEANGRIDEAAFVLAELLNNPSECVALLERHERFETAAELAEARELSGPLVVRLWWLAGNKSRSIDVARKTNSLDQALKLLEKHSAESAREFRLQWIDLLERSGNLHGAIAIGWDDPEIRPLLINPIRRGIAADDDWSFGLRAYLVALQPTDENRSGFLEAANNPDETLAARRFAAKALAEARCSDPAIDRQLCSAAIRSFVQTLAPATKSDRSLDVVRKRADPVLAADLRNPTRLGAAPETVDIPAVPTGARSVTDAVPLSNGTTLIGLGEAGVRLITPDGRTAAEWSTPCHALVASDHEKSALVIARRDHIVDVHVLDLITRRMRHYGPIQTDLWARSFDGGVWVARAENGRLAFYDTLADTPTITWRELDENLVCHRLERSQHSLAVIAASVPSPAFPGPQIQMWRWKLPGRVLDDRRNLRQKGLPISLHLLSDGHVIWTGENGKALNITPVGWVAENTWLDGAEIRVSEEFVGLRRADGLVTVHHGLEGFKHPILTWDVGETEWNFRAQREQIALWTSNGALAVVDVEHKALVSVTSRL